MPTTSLPYQISTDASGNDTLTIVVDFTPHVLHRGEESFDLALAVLTDDTLTDDDRKERLVKILTPVLAVAEAIDGDRVKIEYNRVTLDGEVLPSGITSKLLKVVRNGLPIAPWKRFAVRCKMNPSAVAQAELNDFMEAGDLPVTEDGCFLAYKRVRDDFTDCHTGTFDNTPGRIVEIPREDVDADRSRTCSNGLHVCSQAYLKNFWSGQGRIVVVKVNPADVVSIPIDYNFTKARVSRYEVVAEVPLDTEHQKAEWGVYAPAEWNGTYEDDLDDWDAPEEEVEEEEYALYDSNGDAYEYSDSVAELESVAEVDGQWNDLLTTWEIRDADGNVIVTYEDDLDAEEEDGVVTESPRLDSMEEVVADADANRLPGESRMEYLKRKWRNRGN